MQEQRRRRSCLQNVSQSESTSTTTRSHSLFRFPKKLIDRLPPIAVATDVAHAEPATSSTAVVEVGRSMYPHDGNLLAADDSKLIKATTAATATTLVGCTSSLLTHSRRKSARAKGHQRNSYSLPRSYINQGSSLSIWVKRLTPSK